MPTVTPQAAPAPKIKRRVLNRDKLEADIATVAVQVFAECGYEGTSIATVAEKAGVSTLKAVKRAGRLSPLLAREVGVVAANALDGEALRLVGASVARLDIAAARAASGSLTPMIVASVISSTG